jgi:hypothetical protein
MSVGCRSTSSKEVKLATSSPVPDISSRVDEWVWDAALFARDKSLLELRRLAPVLRETISTRVEKSDEGERTISLRTLHYDGLEITGIEDKGKFILDGVSITSPHWKVPNGLDIGARGNLVCPVFGLPERELKSPEELFSGLACSVNFTSKGGRISKVSYAYFSD